MGQGFLAPYLFYIAKLSYKRSVMIYIIMVCLLNTFNLCQV